MLAAATILMGNLSALSRSAVEAPLWAFPAFPMRTTCSSVLSPSLTVPSAVTAIWFYLFTCSSATMAVFGVMAYVAGEDDTDPRSWQL